MASRVIIEVTDFGADPTGTRDSAEAVSAALNAARAADAPVTVRFAPGRYQIYPEHAQRRDLFVSNTVGADPRYRTKTIGMLVEHSRDLVLDGQGCSLVFHGAQTAFAAIDSSGVRFEDFSFDYVAPRVIDATVEAGGVTDGVAWRELSLPADVRFRIDGTRVIWLGEARPDDGEPYWTGVEAMQYTQVHDPIARRTWRADNPLFDGVAAARPLPGNRIRIEYRHAEAPGDVGLVYQMRDTVRDHPGVLIWKSHDVHIRGVRAHYLHGFGIAGQLSRGLTIDRVRFRADPATGRSSAGFADFINLSSMGGEVSITNCVFDGPHDDPINIHGTYLVLQQTIASDTVTLVYRHPETAGFPAFHPGDEIEFSARGSLDSATAFRARVVAVDGPHPQEPETMLVTIDRDLPSRVVPDEWVAENITYTASVHIADNEFVNVPTRGVLVTTRRPVVIERNFFDGVSMAGVYVSSDAEEWFESGPVTDLTIRDNRFLRPATPAILIAPTNTVLDPAHPVHRGITVCGNEFQDAVAPIVSARSVAGLRVTGNSLTGTNAVARADLVETVGCSSVTVEDATKAAEDRV